MVSQHRNSRLVSLISIARFICIGMMMANLKLYGAKSIATIQKELPKVIPTTTNTCFTAACNFTAFHIINNMDESVDPCDDFYKFACGNFLKISSIPDDDDSVNPFKEVDMEVQEHLRKIMEETIMPDQPKFIRLVKNLYKSCMNEHLIEEQGVEPLLELLEVLGGWPVLDGDCWDENNFDWIKSAYKSRNIGLAMDYFIEFSVSTNFVNTTKRIIHLDQPPLGLAHEILVKGRGDKIVQAYHKYMFDIAVRLGAPEKAAKIELIESLEFEMALANISLPSEKRRNITLQHNPTTIKELSQKYPSIPWKEHFNRLLAPIVSVDDTEIINVINPSYLSNFEKLMNTTSRRTQANYAMWRTAMTLISYLNEGIKEAQLEYTSYLDGKAKRQDRWKECVEVVSEQLPLSVGSLYINKHFSADAKRNAVEMVQDIRNHFNEILKKVDWMDEDTRKNALDKATSMSEHIAYPDELLDVKKLEEFYRALELSNDNYFRNMLNLSLFYMELSFGKLKESVNKTDWRDYGNAAIVNAFYAPLQNSIQLPAGILQGQFFNNERPKYMNYGAIGFIIGHEVSHGFDDQGRQFDKHGNLIDWWAPLTAEKYLRKAQCISNQYSNYTDSEVGLHLNGINTLGENIADNGGVKTAYLAYKKWKSENEEEQSLPGLKYTPQQLFWISSANVWCTKDRPENRNMSITTDTHSPGEYRVIGPFSNMIEFANDFNCSAGTKMNPKDKCAVW